MAKKILVTSALPYANGPIHIGHLVEYIQTDIFVRLLKLTGKDAIYCCADDTHGAPIQINAEKQGMSPEAFVKKFYKEHTDDFNAFHIHFDSYYTTNSEENKHYSDLIFAKAKEKGLIYQKDLPQLYCPNCKRFLPDRYVKGTCPNCGADDQYGDVCEKCSKTHKTTDLLNPKCSICGSTPIIKSSKHYFFKLSEMSNQLKEYISSSDFQPEVKNFVLNWIKEGLEDWCISRDGPYFGFKIPGEEEKYYYVWMDAPIGYISSTANYCKTQANEKNKCTAEDYWKGKDSEIIHFIGKDIIYFHYLFWPAMLMASGFNLPKKMYVHGFLTVNREKMSKSRGTFLTAKDFLAIANPEFLRYYYASHLSSTLGDIDLDTADFKKKVNDELIANIANFAYRVLSFANKNFDSRLGKLHRSPVLDEIKNKFDIIEKSYEAINFKQAIKEILAVGDLGNRYFQENQPWKLIKEDKEKAHEVITNAANIVKDIAILLKPVLPAFCSDIEKQLNAKELSWKDLGTPLQNHELGEAAIIFRRLENELESLGKKQESSEKHDPFSMLDLKVAKVLDVSDHPEAEKLYIITIEIGAGEKRTIVAGMKRYYTKEELIGKNIVIVLNLKPARLRGVESKGMLLAAEKDEENVGLLLAPNSKPGDDVFAEGIAKNPKKEVTIDEFSKLGIKAEKGKAFYKGDVLKTAKEEVIVDKVRDGKVC